MTIHQKTTIKSYFETDDTPTEAQFVDLIDSYQDHHDVLQAIGTAAQNGLTGVIEVLSSADVTTHPMGAVGIRLVEASNTAQALGALSLAEPGTLGLEILQVSATASAYGHLGITSAGHSLIEQTTTAGMRNLLDVVVSAATTAEVSARASANKFVAPHTMGANPLMPRFWVVVGGISANGATIDSGVNVAAVSAVGSAVRVHLSSPFSNADWCPVALCMTEASGADRVPVVEFNTKNTSAVTINMSNAAGAKTNPEKLYVVGWGF